MNPVSFCFSGERSLTPVGEYSMSIADRLIYNMWLNTSVRV